MDNKFLKGLFTGIVTSVLLVVIYLLALNISELNSSGIALGGDKQLELTEKIQILQGYVDKYYYEDEHIDVDKMLEYAYKGYIEGLGDPYSTYMTYEEVQLLQEDYEGKYSGIGAYIEYDTEKSTFMLIPMIGSPAEEAGILPGDLILQVNGEEAYQFNSNELVSRIKGEEGTEVELKIYREETNEYLDITVVRDTILTPTISYEMLEDNIGYIQITQFKDTTHSQFVEALEELEEQGQEGLIIDLRNNPGGLMTSVVSIADELLPKGLIVYTEDKEGNRTEEFSEKESEFDKPLVILINENSASASEILSGAVKDYEVGTIVGTTTFGKGLVQRPIYMSDGSAVYLTIAKYYTPSGEYIHDKGIEPDIEVELPDEHKNKLSIERDEDTQLQKAIEVIKE